jgi:hypothetical protein
MAAAKSIPAPSPFADKPKKKAAGPIIAATTFPILRSDNLHRNLAG